MFAVALVFMDVAMAVQVVVDKTKIRKHLFVFYL
jgi:hypothetical protein